VRFYSPRRPPDDVLGGLLRPRNLSEKAALNAGWLDSSRSLLEQFLFENDLILLRFKFMTFFELNPKVAVTIYRVHLLFHSYS